MRPLRVALVQMDPQLKQVSDNIARADCLLQKYLDPVIGKAAGTATGPAIDLIVLPELVFTGYVFRDRNEILPFAENAESGPTVRWCRSAAKRYRSFVCAGFPEIGPAIGSAASMPPLFNSQCLVDRSGHLVHVHRKNFLYETDETWCTSGGKFQPVDVPGLARANFAICMDLNPCQFKAPFRKFEFASSCFEPALEMDETLQTDAFKVRDGESKEKEKHRLLCEAVISSMNWLHSQQPGKSDDRQRSSPESDSGAVHDLVNYWAIRLSPLLGQPVYAYICNRVGTERGVRFAGTSCVIDLQRKRLLACLDDVEESVLILE